MTDRVYPSTKPNGTATNHHPAAAPPIPNPPPTKPPPYIPTRHPYRPTPPTRPRPKHDRRRLSCRRCCCLTFFWSILILIAVLLLAAIAAAAFYVLYHPQRPLFSVTSLRISTFNLTTTPADESTLLTTRINVTLSARNPNSKITYIYDPMSIAVRSNSIDLSYGSFLNFTSSPGNITVIHTAMAMNSRVLDPDSVSSLQSDLKRKRGLLMEIVIDTMVGVKMEKLKVKKVGIRIRCGGVHGVMPKGKNVTSAKTENAKCKVDLRVKILKWWTF